SQVVNPDGTSVTLTTSVNPSVLSKSITLQATVTVSAPGAGTPTGTVTFKDGTAILGTGSLNSAGVATFATDTLAAGAHALTAVYGGDTNGLTSTSNSLTQNIQQATSTTLTSSGNPSVLGQSVMFTVTVASVGTSTVTPTGSVIFRDGAISLGT